MTCLADELTAELKVAVSHRNRKAASTDMFAYGLAVGRQQAIAEMLVKIIGGNPEEHVDEMNVILQRERGTT